jgi:calmodulin
MDADQLEDEAIEDAFQEADADGNKNIDFLEFASWLMRHNFDEFLVAHNREERQSNRIIANKLGMTFVEVENYRAKFNHFDADDSGTIEKDEFLQLLSTTMKVSKENIPASRVQTWWRAADLDGNGHIDFEEFIKFHKKFFGATINGTTNLDTIYRTGGLMDLIPSKERAPARPSRNDRTPRPQ